MCADRKMFVLQTAQTSLAGRSGDILGEGTSEIKDFSNSFFQLPVGLFAELAVRATETFIGLQMRGCQNWAHEKLIKYHIWNVSIL